MIKNLIQIILILIILYSYIFGATYQSSAHGNSNYGVNRQAVNQFHIGNCKHCHDMHNSSPNSYTLFYQGFTGQTDNFCLQCHDYTTNVSSNPVCNRSYSYRAGGYASDTVSSVKEQFDTSLQTSAHDLNDILTFIQSQSWNFNSSSSPCVACHNPHYVQGDPFNSSNSPKSSSSRGWLITRPSKHGSNNNSDRLWGDEIGEKMSDYASGYTYQAPHRYNSTTAYEPDGSSTINGSNLTDFPTFCQDCHTSNMQNAPYNLANTPIDWSSSGDKHGLAPADGGIDIKSPYSSSNYGNYVLSCTDCHEPHGSKNAYLIRIEVNGSSLSSQVTDISGKNMGYLCMKCHKDDSAAGIGSTNEWEYVHHKSPDHPYAQFRCGPCHGGPGTPISCNQCHLHGKIDSRTGRKCF